MLLRCKKRDLLVVLIFACLGIVMLNVSESSGISNRFSASITTNKGVHFDYLIDVLNEKKMLLQSTLKVDNKSYSYTRLYDLVKLGSNTYVISETRPGEKQEENVEQAFKYDFFHPVQKLVLYTLSPRALVVASEGKFILADTQEK